MFSAQSSTPFTTSVAPIQSPVIHHAESCPQFYQAHSDSKLTPICRAISSLSDEVIRTNINQSPDFFSRLSMLEKAHKVSQILGKGKNLDMVCLQDKLGCFQLQHQAIKKGVQISPNLTSSADE